MKSPLRAFDCRSSCSREASGPLPGSEDYFFLNSGDCELLGRFLKGMCCRSRSVLFSIHGARSDLTAFDPILYPLQALGLSSLAFNLSGHNAASPISLERSCLSKNLAEALRFYEVQPESNAVFGLSMGGALALKLAEVHEGKIEKIILACPAIYPESAYGPAFGDPFRRAISTPFGFLDSSSLAFLRRFRGTVLLIMGEYDGLRANDFGYQSGRSVGEVIVNGRSVYSAIPYEVVQAIEGAVSRENIEKIILPGCDHGISAWLRSDPQRQKRLAERIFNFLDA